MTYLPVVISYICLATTFGEETYYYASSPKEGFNKTLTLTYLNGFGFGSTSFPGSRAALRVGLQTVQNRGLLPEFGLRYMFGHSNCNGRIAMQKAVDIWKNSGGLDGIIGAGCSIACQPVSLLAAAWSIPVISYGCASSTLSNKEVYPTFARTAGTYSSYVLAMDAMIKLFKWTRVGILCDVIELYKNTGKALKYALEARGVQVYYYSIAPTETNRAVLPENMEKQKSVIRQLKKVSNVICIFMYKEDIRNALVNMYEEDMHDGQHVFMGLEVHPGYISDPVYKAHYGLEIWQGWTLIAPADIKGRKWNKFRVDVARALHDPDLNDVRAVHPNVAMENVDTYADLTETYNWATEGLAGFCLESCPY